VIYLDNAATSFPKPEQVYVAMDRFARTTLANPGRSGHRMALESEHAVLTGRSRLNKFFNGVDALRIIFTMNGTDSLNMAIKGAVNPGDHVITTELEHNSVSRPLVALEQAGVITLTRIHTDAGGTIRVEELKQAITPKTTMVVLTHASNVLGTIQPVSEVGAICRERNILFLVDAAQTAGVVPIDVQAMNIDLLALPGHKCLFGPTGIGVLYVGPRAKLKPWREGGSGGDSTTPVQPADYPHCLEGGTPNVLGIVGMTAGLDFVEERGVDALRQHEVELCDLLRSELEPHGFEFFGHRDLNKRVGAISFRHADMPAPELGAVLDQAFAIAIRPGLHCAPYVHRAMKTMPEGTIRVSPGPFNTKDDILAIANALKEATSLG
jgi:cysteine desulfurase / selenocysteine lyase